MTILDAQILDELHEILDASNRHYIEGTRIWNGFGLDNPQFASDAAYAALIQYQRAVDLIDLGRFSRLPQEVMNRVLAFREQVLAQVATMKFYAAGDREDCEERLKHANDAVTHLRNAIGRLEMSRSIDESHLFSLQTDLLHCEGCQANMLAKRASRNGEYADAIRFYQYGESKYLTLMDLCESRAPELAAVRSRFDEPPDLNWNSETTVDNSGIRFRARILHTQGQPSILSDHDKYLRAVANYYSNAGSRSNLEAFEILSKERLPQAAEDKLANAVDCIYRAMEAFPANLEFHRDLVAAWRARGELFGCPFIETEVAVHTRCPIAIKYLVGEWYVSPTLEYDSLLCNVCGKDILECSHFPGQVVDGTTVAYQRANPRISSVSLVDIPEDPRCVIEWISLPKDYLPPRPKPDSQWRCFMCQVETANGMLVGPPTELPSRELSVS
ncbi:MAG: hypothetical protein WA040_19840 [Anaerolineae bacterium]